MLPKEVIEKAYGNIPREVGNITILDWLPGYSSKKLFIKLLRFFRKFSSLFQR